MQGLNSERGGMAPLCCAARVRKWHSSTVRGSAPILPLSGGKLTVGERGYEGRS